MIFSKATIYGIKSIVYVAKQQNGKDYVSIREIAEKLEIPFHFLTKILQKLTHAGIIVSSKGVKGGVRINKSLDEVSLRDLVGAIDNIEEIDRCVLGFSRCNSNDPCILHSYWLDPKTMINSMLSGKNLEELAKKTNISNL
ncbi:MAG: Rrf2 family transcriptional regulator [Ignavibacteriaceae bacterium]|nr:Rrf2 family transcriptional regulator [Ignavibacteriaceae bacterium]